MLNHELNVELLLVFGMSIYMNKTEECLMNSTEEMCKGQHWRMCNEQQWIQRRTDEEQHWILEENKWTALKPGLAAWAISVN
jgi:hypothetical protein